MIRFKETIDSISCFIFRHYIAFDDSVDVLRISGVVFLDGLGDASRAIEYFRTATEINPNYVLAHFNMARSHEAMGEKIAAAKQYQKALNINRQTNELDFKLIEDRLYKLFET